VLDQLRATVQGYKDLAISLLRRFIQIPTENANESKLAQAIDEVAKKWGLHTRFYEKEPGRGNIVVSTGFETPSLALVCHMDTVPAGEGWTYPPFEGVVVDDRIYGRGAVDNKGSIVAALLAVRALSEAGVRLKGSIHIVCAAGEETGSPFGLPFLLDEVKLRYDHVVVCEPTDGDKVEVAEKGALFLRLATYGKQAHGSMPHLGVNAILLMTQLLTRVTSHTFRYDPHPLLGHPTLNVGRIEGGVATNVVPASCRADLDIRYLPSQTPEGIVAEIQDIIQQLERENPQFRASVEIVKHMPPAETDPKHPLVQTLSHTVRDVIGRVEVVGIGGTTFAKFFRLRGMPAVVYGPGLERLCHQADEYIHVSDLLNAALVYASTAVRLLH